MSEATQVSRTITGNPAENATPSDSAATTQRPAKVLASYPAADGHADEVGLAERLRLAVASIDRVEESIAELLDQGVLADRYHAEQFIALHACLRADLCQALGDAACHSQGVVLAA